MLAARDVLARGGTAADAAVNLYFTLAITYPSQAGLGGGGICMVYDPNLGRADVLDFSRVAAGPGGDAVAVPSAARGMAWLHARFGRLTWGSLLSQTAGSAREGVTTSRALIADLKTSAPQLANDATALSLFFNRLGEPIGEGIIFQQIELGAVLGQMGARGGGAFYRGALAKRIVAAARTQNQRVDPGILNATKPKWLRAKAYRLKNRTIYFPPVGAGKAAAEMWQRLSAGTGLEKLDTAAQTARLAAAAKSTVGARAGKSTAEVGTGFTVVDGSGLAVVCSVTNGKKFGTGKFLPGLGFALVPAPGQGEAERQSMAPVLAVDHQEKKFIFGASGNAGPRAVSAVVGIAARTLLAGERLVRASDRPRVHIDGGDAIIAEKAVTAKEIAALEKSGAKVTRVPAIGRINAIYCPAGLPPDSRRDPPCQVKADKRGYGVGARFKKDLQDRN